MKIVTRLFLGFTMLVIAGALYWANSQFNESPAAPRTDVRPQMSVFPMDDGTESAEGAAPENAEERRNDTGLPLKLPPGFSVSLFAEGLTGARVLAFDPKGKLVVSLTGEGRVVVLSETEDGKPKTSKNLLSGLSKPHGLLFTFESGNPKLYVAETDKLVKYDYDPDKTEAKNPRKILTLPGNGRHSTRTLLELPDGRILVSVGSSCDTCVEKNSNRASVLAVSPDGRSVKKYATGLRNSVFLEIHPKTKQVWATEMGRDYLGDDLPPDEINVLKEGAFYGWPYCYGKKVQDVSFSKSRNAAAVCARSSPSFADIPAHSAPLGLAFVPDDWPKEYRGNLLVALHGSWNRSVPTGHKIVLLRLDAQGKYLGREDFLTGWLTDEKSTGRPVDLLFSPDGTLYVSDDGNGKVYRVRKTEGL